LNGDTIERISSILKGDEAIPAKVTNQMIFVAIMHERDERKEDFNSAEEARKEDFEKVKEMNKELKSDIDKIKQNPMVLFGDLLKDNPKAAGFVAFLILLVVGFLLSGAEIPVWLIDLIK